MRLLDFATAYIDGDMKINGPISQAVDALDAVNVITDKRQTISEISKAFIFRFLKALIPRIGMTFESINHYAQSADAYELFLDRYMQYTCGRFETGDEDLDEAQLAKFNMIERLARNHLGSLAGKDHLDIGCGWGGMLSYFEKQFGTCSVGNTNCRQQMNYATQHYSAKIVYGDFSELEDYNRRFDLITVVGMIEHLTPYRRSRLLDAVSRLLNPNGIVYLQCITRPSNWVGGDAYRFVEREIFPGHYLESREMTENRLRRHRFRILSQFEHGFDYGLTTAHWARRIQENETKLCGILGVRRYRAYLGYLAFASKLFSTGRGSLMRYTLTKA
jgi:cyclopropane-fatty-acyl-phospholipid synthase